jgi:hypothetical protein
MMRPQLRPHTILKHGAIPFRTKSKRREPLVLLHLTGHTRVGHFHATFAFDDRASTTTIQ